MKITDKSALVMASIVSLIGAAIILTVMAKENRKTQDFSFKVGPVKDSLGNRSFVRSGSTGDTLIKHPGRIAFEDDSKNYAATVYSGYPGHPEYGSVTAQEIDEGRYNNYQYYRPDTLVGFTDGTRLSSQYPHLWTLGYPVIEANAIGHYRIRIGDQKYWRPVLGHKDEPRGVVEDAFYATCDSAESIAGMAEFLQKRHTWDSAAHAEDLANKADWDATWAGKKEFHKISK